MKTNHAFSPPDLRIIPLLFMLVACSSTCHAQIERWDNGLVIPGTQDITPGPKLVLKYWSNDDRNLRYADFSEQDLSGSVFNDVWLRGANFRSSDLTKADFRRSELTDSDLSGTDLTSAVFGSVSGAELTGAVITGAGFGIPGPKSMALDRCSSEASEAVALVPEQLYSTRSYQEKDLRGIRLHCSDLSSWDLHEQNLTAAFLRGNLSHANFSGANLTGASLLGNLAAANLTDATIVHARLQNLSPEQLYSTRSHRMMDLRGTTFESSSGELSGWDFRGQDLAGASFHSASLLGSDFTGANLKNTNFDDSDFDSAVVSSFTVYNQWTQFPNGFDPDAAGLTFEASIAGDFDANNLVDAQDYKMLESFLNDESRWWLHDMFDLNQSGSIDNDDLNTWITEVKQATPGDADLDGAVAFSDFLILSQNFRGQGGWTSGDFDHNEEIQFADFLLLSENFGIGPPAATAVPEPSGLHISLFGLWSLMTFRKRLTGRKSTRPITRSTDATFESLQDRRLLTEIGFATHEVDVSTDANAPSVVITADVDGDDDQDVVVASLSDHRLAWYENTESQGSFGTHHIVATVDTYFPRSAAVADLDGDGDLDLVSAFDRHNYGSPEERILSWHENLDGKGNFSGLQLLDSSTSELKPGTQTTEIADVDNDGHLDILVVTTGGIFNDENQSFEFSWLRNIDGRANFVERRVLYTGEGELDSHEFADMDGDGDLDLLLVSESASPDLPGTVRNITTKWIEQTDGLGTFSNEHVLAQATTQEYYTSRVWAVDMDKDGDVDVLSSRRGFNDEEGGTDELIWFDNFGNGSFSEERTFAPHPQGLLVSIRDLNGDGLPDLTSLDDRRRFKYSPSLDGKGTLGDTVQVTTKHRGNLNSLDTGDFDGDGDIDLVVALGNPDAIIWFENTDGQSFADGGELSAQKPRATFLHASDMDSDGDLDVFAAFQTDDWGSMAWYENTDGLGTFGEARHIESEEYWWENEIPRIDLDDDGYLDIVHSAEWGVYWLRNLKGEGFAQEQLVLDLSDEPNYVSFDFADFDADGDIDILSSARVRQKSVIVWHENIGVQGGLTFAQDTHFVSEGPQVTASIADLDRDGDPDIFTRQNGPVSRIGLHENLGTGVFGEESTIVDELDRHVGNIVPTDIDGDQDLDLLVTSRWSCTTFGIARCDRNLVWHPNTDGTFGAAQEIAPYVLDEFFAVDFDNDGDVDIVTTDTSGVGWHENDGSGQFSSREMIGQGLSPEQLADIDGDGDLDAITTSRTAAFAWHENRIAGDADGDEEVSFADFLVLSNNFGRQIDAVWADGDFDGDGDVSFADFLILSENYGKTALSD